MNAKFYNDHIAANDDLAKLAKGFIRSYCLIITSLMDLNRAQELCLVPKSIDWDGWEKYREAVLDKVIASEYSQRRRYGELRLFRLSMIHRLTFHGLKCFSVYRTYDGYLRQDLQFYLAGFGFTTIVLTRMQFILGVEGKEKWVQDLCYRFLLVALIGVIACLGALTVIFLCLLLCYAGLAVMKHLRKRATNATLHT